MFQPNKTSAHHVEPREAVDRRSRRGRVLAATVALVTAAAALTAFTATASQAAPTPPAASNGPVGWDSFRHPERLAEIGTHAKTRQFSSFDRAGGNGQDGFDGKYSCLRTTSAGCVLAERTGAGEIESIWFTRDEGNVSATGTITVEVDGKTVLSGSLQEIVDGKKGAPFVYPLVANGAQSSGGVYIKVPMAYRSSMRVTTQKNPLFYHVTYRDFVTPAGVSTFNPADKAADVLAALGKAGTADPKPAQPGATTRKSAVNVPAGATKTVATATGAGAISALAFTLPQLTAGEAASDALLGDARLQILFDGKKTVDSPLGEFFGTGLGLYEVRSMMFGVDPKTKRLSSWWQMPYRAKAEIRIHNGSKTAITGGTSEVTSARSAQGQHQLAAGRAGYFHATSARGDAKRGWDHVFLDATGQGRVVGVTQTVDGRAPSPAREYLEGDERMFADGTLSPDMHGTGTEDLYEGGWYFNHGTFNAPMNGNPVHEEKKAGCQYDCTGMYRLLIGGGAEYDERMRFSIEHGGANAAPAVYGSTTYSYQGPPPTLRWSDDLDVGDPRSERAHAYTSATPGAVTKIASTYEGHDGRQGGVTVPVALTARQTTAPVTFRLATDRTNKGVVIRRTSDQQTGYQAAKVSINGKEAGVWSQSLANPVQRWLDDSFTVPAALSAGKSSLTVRLTPISGGPAWSAASYASLSSLPVYRDRETPQPVGGAFTTSGERNTIDISWQPARDDVYSPRYEVYGSKRPGFAVGSGTLLGTTTVPSFRHDELGVRETWYYRVRAIDQAGRAGRPSAEVHGVSGAIMRFEAEKLLPPVSATAPVGDQGDCCGVNWSEGAQLWLQPTAADKQVTVAFKVSAAGTYDLSTIQTKAPDYGITTMALDGKVIGTPVDGYHPNAVVLTDVLKYGQHKLTAGEHRLTLTVTGKNAAAKGFFAGLDYLDARLVG